MVRTPTVGDKVHDTFRNRTLEVVRIKRDAPGSHDGMLYLARPGARARHQRRCETAASLAPDDRPHLFRDDPTPPVPGSPYILRVFRSLVSVGAFSLDADSETTETPDEAQPVETTDPDAVKSKRAESDTAEQVQIQDTLSW